MTDIYLSISLSTHSGDDTSQKYLESFEMWCWRRMEKISWTGRVRNELFHRVKEQRNILKMIKMRKINRIGQISRIDCLIKHVIE